MSLYYNVFIFQDEILSLYHFWKTNVRYACSFTYLYTVFCRTLACIHSYKSTKSFPRRLCNCGGRLIGWPLLYCQLRRWEHTHRYLGEKLLVTLLLFFLPCCPPRALPFCFPMCERVWLICTCIFAWLLVTHYNEKCYEKKKFPRNLLKSIFCRRRLKLIKWIPRLLSETKLRGNW